jgi:glutamate formiminotransferase
MAGPILECVANVSEGRDLERVARFAAAAVRGGAKLLDATSDPDHHRSVFTLAGEPEPLHGGLVALAELAVAEIDLRRHDGIHPRVGALDVVPFVPLAGATWDHALAAARRFGATVAERLDLPVWLYERAATSARHRPLPALRRGGFEGLAPRLASPEWRPDFGPPRPHPTAGACIVGARSLLVAFNVVIDGDLDCARRVARAIRESSGGLPAVRAIGVWLGRRGLAQVSLNLLDTERTSVERAFAEVEVETGRCGARVVESELIGLAAQRALPPSVIERTRLVIDRDPILEHALERAGLPSNLPSQVP